MKRISTQLIVSFLIIALLPTLPLSLVVKDLLERRFGPTIAHPLEQALEAGLAESRAHLREIRTNFGFRAQEMSLEILEEQGYLLDFSGQVQPADSLVVFLQSRVGLWQKAAALDVVESGGDFRSQRFDDTLAIRINGSRGNSSIILQPLPDGMVARAGDLTAGISLLRIVRGESSRVLFSFVGPFILVYGLLIIVALVVGILWSRQMVKPLEILVGATRRVAKGDLEFRINKHGPGEVGELIKSFDQMIGNLAEQRRDLVRLERAAAWRGMARTLAHEVKNPLTPILLAVNQARDSYVGDDEQYKALLDEIAEIVGEEVESLRSLVREFGDFARLPKPDLKPGNLNEMLLELGHLYGPENLQLDLTDNTDGWFDHNSLRRALINLIDNGLAACQEAGHPPKVQLVLNRTKQGVRLMVKDDGAGIAKKHLDKIFEPDFTTKSGGMGLGLAIVENIILGHGGKIKVESKLGHGAEFEILLPLTQVGSGTQSPGGDEE